MILCSGCGYAITSTPQQCDAIECNALVHVQWSANCWTKHNVTHGNSYEKRRVRFIEPAPFQQNVNEGSPLLIMD